MYLQITFFSGCYFEVDKTGKNYQHGQDRLIHYLQTDKVLEIIEFKEKSYFKHKHQYLVLRFFNFKSLYPPKNIFKLCADLFTKLTQWRTDSCIMMESGE